MKMSVYRMMEISFLKYNFFMICPSLSKCDFSISYPQKLVKAIQPTVSQVISTVVCGVLRYKGNEKQKRMVYQFLIEIENRAREPKVFLFQQSLLWIYRSLLWLF